MTGTMNVPNSAQVQHTLLKHSN